MLECVVNQRQELAHQLLESSMDHSTGTEAGSFQFAERMRDIAAVYSLRDKRFRFLNAAAERILGIPRSAILADAALLLPLILDQDRPLAAAFLAKAESEGLAEAEFRIRRPDGTQRWIFARAFPMEPGGDEQERALICEDVTESKRIRSELSESETRFFQIVENIDEVFWVVAPDGAQVHYASPTYEKIWGRPAAELYASPFKWVQSVHEEDQARVLETVTTQQAERPLEIYFRVVRPDGEIRDVRRRSVPVRDGTGRVFQVVCLNEDVTEQKRLERQAEESARAQRDALVREVHHRIKNNLQGVTGMLRNYANQHAEVAGVISEAIAQVQAVAIIYGLQGRPGVARVMLDDILNEVISGIGQLMHRAMKLGNEGNCGCRVVVSELEAVPVALVLNEIIFNAAKHADSEAELEIDLRIDIAQERVMLTVANSGRLNRVGARPATGGGSGLKLIHSLLPRRGAKFELNDSGNGVVARLTLEPPIVTLKC